MWPLKGGLARVFGSVEQSKSYLQFYRAEQELLELASRGQRESRGGIHAT